MNSIDYLRAYGFLPFEDYFGCCYKLQLAYGVSLRLRLFDKDKVIDILLFDYTAQDQIIEDELFIKDFNIKDSMKTKKLKEFINKFYSPDSR